MTNKTLLCLLAATSVAALSLPSLQAPTLAAPMALAAEPDLPPPPQERVIKFGKRRFTVRVSMATVLPGNVFEGQTVVGSTHALVTVSTADGLPLPPEGDIPRLFFRRGSRWIPVRLRLVPTTSQGPFDSATYAGETDRPIAGGSLINVITQVNYRRSWGRADFRNLPVATAGPTQ